MLKQTLIFVTCFFCIVSCKKPTPNTDSTTVVSQDTIASPSAATLKTNKTSFGLYHHSRGDTYKTLDYTSLHSVVYVSYELNLSTGEAITTHDWEITQLIDSLQAHKVKCLLAITNEDKGGNKTFLRNAKATNTLMDNAIAQMQKRNAHGIHLGLQKIAARNKDFFSKFVKEFSHRLKQSDSDAMLTILLPIEGYALWDLKTLNQSVDHFILLDSYNNLKTIQQHCLSIGIPEEKLVIATKL